MAHNDYAPDLVTPPGETLIELLNDIGMTQAELAVRTGRPRKTINEIVKGKAEITPDTALQLERVLGTTATFWMNRERQYREWLARHNDRNAMAQHKEWVKQFPIRRMAQWGWIEQGNDAVEQVIELLRFFGIASPEQWEAIWNEPTVAYRQSSAFRHNPRAISAWLRKGEIDAAAIPCKPYNSDAFDSALVTARTLTTTNPDVFVLTLTQLCADAGVAVTFNPELPDIHISGATRWLTSTKALIMLSLRHKTDDHLWFTFFHEAGHILLHGKRDTFIDMANGSDSTELEEEANRFAQNRLIPQAHLDRFAPAGRHYTVDEIQAFAKKIGIAEGIVVGRLQHDKRVENSHLNKLKQRYVWKEDTTDTD